MRRVLGTACAVGLSLGLAGQALAAEDTSVDELIVTGTRVTGLRVSDSAAPIQVVGQAALERTVSTDLVNTLALMAPSFTAQAVGGDTANETLSARLRGLSPNHALVLINGKRRHGASNLAILSSAYQGGAAADLNFIPPAAIARIEILQDGAAAQYGSDAIAGVINIILKQDADGGSVDLLAGQYFEGDGDTGEVSFNAGFAPADGVFVNVSALSRYHSYSNRGGPDQRVEQAIASGAHPEWRNLPGYPYLNKIFGDARYQLNLVTVNAGADLGGETRAYATATYGRKYGGGWANFRLPTRLPALYPLGFDPIDTTKEEDFAFTGGVAGVAAAWTWDLSTTWGRDDIGVNVTNSANIDLYNDTGSTPSAFHAGDFIATQWTTTLDVTRPFELMARPATFAAGLERREEIYEIKAGDPASRYKAGSQSYPGFALTDAGKHARDNWAIYADLAFAPLPDTTLDIAVRHEKFSDFGDTTVGKLTGRWDITPAFAIRGTASTGFRAPTLAESYYSATNVQPNSAFVQLPPNAPAAALIGIDKLRPETSVNFSAGFLARPGAGVTITLDAYQIEVEDRVVGSGTLYGFYNGAVRSAAVNAAIAANGNVLEPVPFSGVNVFSNGVDTRTRGADLVVTWSNSLGAPGRIDWTLAANYNETKVTGVRAAPAQLSASGQSLFDKVALSTLATASPKTKLVAGALWQAGRWSVDLRETWYGQTSRYSDPGDGRYYLDKAGAKLITDLAVGYRVTDQVTMTLGANNLFDVHPDRVNPAGLAASAAAGNPAVEVYPAFSPFGINGGFYYAKVGYRF
ncbi:TonB-dependent receptor [Phenylobacterium sp.]|uniref:TonB-dependent receptor plug domain-containing protein n=1 Tax=Phenylobacterium sp. TaxID=1871053 RepID=UPI00286D7A84|nr:TonB-dependent receptor [Phenylobacterium sp.]